MLNRSSRKALFDNYCFAECFVSTSVTFSSLLTLRTLSLLDLTSFCIQKYVTSVCFNRSIPCIWRMCSVTSHRRQARFSSRIQDHKTKTSFLWLRCSQRCYVQFWLCPAPCIDLLLTCEDFQCETVEQFHDRTWWLSSALATFSIWVGIWHDSSTIFRKWTLAPTAFHASSIRLTSSILKTLLCGGVDSLWHNPLTMSGMSARSWLKNKHLSTCDLHLLDCV